MLTKKLFLVSVTTTQGDNIIMEVREYLARNMQDAQDWCDMLNSTMIPGMSFSATVLCEG